MSRPENDPFNVSVLEKLSPFTYDETTTKKTMIAARDTTKRDYALYTLDVTSPQYGDEVYNVEVLKNDYDAIRIAKRFSKSGYINCSGTLPKKEGEYITYIFAPASAPTKKKEAP